MAFGIAAAAVFCATNLFLGLKVGLTFSASIPTAAVAMATIGRGAGAPRAVTVQSIASAASTMPNIIFVLPALLLVGHWRGFPFVETATLAAGGGILGVLASLLLAPVMLDDPNLPFPESVAVSEILKLNDLGREPRAAGDFGTVAWSAVGAAALTCLQGAKLLSPGIGIAVRGIGGSVWSLGTDCSLALVGAGYLTGITTGLAMLLGLVIAWGVAVPWLTMSSSHSDDIAGLARAAWSDQARMIGAGMMAVGAVWGLVRLARPLLRAARRPGGRLGERPGSGPGGGLTWPPSPDGMRWLGPRAPIVGVGLALAALASGAAIFGADLATIGPPLLGLGLLGAVVIGVCLMPPCGTIAGMIGTSASPISSIGLIAVASITSCLSFAHATMGGLATEFTALALFLGSAVMAMAAMANGGIECLKTARLVGVSACGQSVALLGGVLVCAIVTPPILQMLYAAYGLAGDPQGHPGSPLDALAAPQAAIMALLASGIIEGGGRWSMLEIGGAVGVVVILADQMLRRARPGMALPVLGVGFGAYLPAGTTTALVIGALLSWIVERPLGRARRETKAQARRRGALIASGLIVGESLCGIAIAGLALIGSHRLGLDLGDGVHGSAELLGALAFAGACLVVARAVMSDAKTAVTEVAR